MKTFKKWAEAEKEKHSHVELVTRSFEPHPTVAVSALKIGTLYFMDGCVEFEVRDREEWGILEDVNEMRLTLGDRMEKKTVLEQEIAILASYIAWRKESEK